MIHNIHVANTEQRAWKHLLGWLTQRLYIANCWYVIRYSFNCGCNLYNSSYTHTQFTMHKYSKRGLPSATEEALEELTVTGGGTRALWITWRREARVWSVMLESLILSGTYKIIYNAYLQSLAVDIVTGHELYNSTVILVTVTHTYQFGSHLFWDTCCSGSLLRLTRWGGTWGGSCICLG